MPDGSYFTLTRLLSPANGKQRMGKGYLTVGLTLTPLATARAGRNLCPHATRGCAAGCYALADRLAWPQNKRVAVARTRLMTQDPAAFRDLLVRDLERARVTARRKGIPLVCRLNMVSDVPFEREFPELFRQFHDVQFMDYTKDAGRLLTKSRPPNLHLTFSRSERNEAECHAVLRAGFNVAVVFRRPPLPKRHWGLPVIDGEAHDFRFLDPSPCVVGLWAKGKAARNDSTGFVVDQRVTLPMVA
jgi:hypothetical protein